MDPIGSIVANAASRTPTGALGGNGLFGPDGMFGGDGLFGADGVAGALRGEQAAAGGAGPAVGGTTAGVGGTTSGSASSIFGLGKDDYFKLFLAQLQNQDPTNAMDTNQMVGQLAQFSMIEMLQQLSDAMQGSQLSQAASLLGRTVTGTDTTGNALTGPVDRVDQTDGGLVLVIGDRTMQADKVTEIAVGASGTSGSGASGGDSSA